MTDFAVSESSRWTLIFDPGTRHYVLTEFWRVRGLWVARTRSSWTTMYEALQHAAVTREQRAQQH